jgi:hypothetical protein
MNYKLLPLLALFLIGCGDSSNDASFSTVNNQAPVTNVAGRYTGTDHQGKASLDLVVDNGGNLSGNYTVTESGDALPVGTYPISGLVDPATGAYSLELPSQSALVRGRLPASEGRAQGYFVHTDSSSSGGTLLHSTIAAAATQLPVTISNVTYQKFDSNSVGLTAPQGRAQFTPRGEGEQLTITLQETDHNLVRQMTLEVFNPKGPVGFGQYPIVDPALGLAGFSGTYVESEKSQPRHWLLAAPISNGYFFDNAFNSPSIDGQFQTQKWAPDPDFYAIGGFNIFFNVKINR